MIQRALIPRMHRLSQVDLALISVNHHSVSLFNFQHLQWVSSKLHNSRLPNTLSSITVNVQHFIDLIISLFSISFIGWWNHVVPKGSFVDGVGLKVHVTFSYFVHALSNGLRSVLNILNCISLLAT